MTATYDNHLVIRTKTKALEPCCEQMHQAIYAKVLYMGTRAKVPVVMMRIAERTGIPIRECPFCGAPVEVA